MKKHKNKNCLNMKIVYAVNYKKMNDKNLDIIRNK